MILKLSKWVPIKAVEIFNFISFRYSDPDLFAKNRKVAGSIPDDVIGIFH